MNVASAATAKVEHGQFPSVDKTHIQTEIIPEIAQWSLTNGLVLASDKATVAKAAPTTVFPTPIPRQSFDQAKALQKPFNQLYAQIANSEWLIKETEQLAKVDPDFTGKLFNLYQKYTAKSKQPTKFGIFRSDYLIEEKTKSVKQVEFNTVSVSFGGLSSKVGDLHSYLNVMGKYDNKGKPFYQAGELHTSESHVFIVRGILNAMNIYQVDLESKKRERDEKIVLFVVEEDELNIYDQKIIEYNLLKIYGIISVRCTFKDIKTQFEYSTDKKRLIHKKTNNEVGVVYFRTGYDVADYSDEAAWETRGFLEESYAIKAPDLSVQLAGTKKIQQLLTKDSILSTYIDDANVKKQLSNSFVKIYPLDDSPEGKEGQKLAIEQPEHYVLKPQREGGGHNVYKKDIPAFLNDLPKEQWNAYILMEIIDTATRKENFIVRDGQLSSEPIISELGIYGTIIFDKDHIANNDYSGSLLRSKLMTSNEGGVVAGFGCIDSMYLY
ncbi:hypothetical protein MOUN0_G06942 [Monosporozyma unispora]|nr:hypothetical protein C6P44_004746 [Kazachstania unispora]